MATESPLHHDVFSALDQTYGLIDGMTGWSDCLEALLGLAGVDACGLMLHDGGRGQSHLIEAGGAPVTTIRQVTVPVIDEFLWRSVPGTVWRPFLAEDRDRQAAASGDFRIFGYAVVDRDSAHILYLEFLKRTAGRDPDERTTRLLHHILPHLHRACRLHRLITGEDLRSLADPSLTRPMAAAGLPIELRLRRRFKLSKAEARVAKLLAGGLAPRMIADRLNVSIHTVRSQLQSIFSKTETSRQAELTSLLLRETEIPRAPSRTPPFDHENRERSSCL